LEEEEESILSGRGDLGEPTATAAAATDDDDDDVNAGSALADALLSMSSLPTNEANRGSP